jgi:PAS domain-containing protein
MLAHARATRAEGASAPDMSAQLSAVLDGALDAAVIRDAQGLIVSWAGEAESIFGWSTAELLEAASGEEARSLAAHGSGTMTDVLTPP